MNNEEEVNVADKKYVIVLNETQLRLIAECVEDCHKLASGDASMENCTSYLESFLQVREILKTTNKLITPPHIHQYPWSGQGCKDTIQRQFIAATYPIYYQMRNFLCKKYGIKDGIYSSDVLTCEEGGEPIQIFGIENK